MKHTTKPEWEATLFNPEFRPGRSRVADWTTSVEGAKSVAYRAGSQKELLLNAYKNAYPASITDEEAAIAAELPLTSCYWKRCGELRQDGMIAPVKNSSNEPVTRLGSSGVHRIVSTYIVKVGE